MEAVSVTESLALFRKSIKFKTQISTTAPENENTNLYKIAICNWNKMILTTTYALHKLQGVAHDTHGQHNGE